MSSHEQALASVLSQLALSFDGAVLGVVLAYAAVRSLFKFTAHSSALRRIRHAPSASVPDLRALLPSSDDQSQSSDQNLVIVSGIVEAKSVVQGNWKSLGRPLILVSQESGDKAVVIQRTQTCLYNEWKGFFGWTSDIRGIFGRSWREKESTSLRTVPFVLVDGGQWPQTDYVCVSMDGSRHPMPLTTVYHQLQPIDASPYTFLQALFGHEYPVGLLDEEKILPLGKEITAVGICSFRNGIPEIKSCKELPYFLSDLTKDQMILDLAFKTKVLLWSGIALGSLSVVVLGYAIIRNWNKWKEWRQQGQPQQSNSGAIASADMTDEEGDVPEGQLCVICLTRKRRSVFIPCWHLACCNRCALSIERDVSPKCPVCRQTIHSSQVIFVP
ncbi:mitochondrial ubiquitin ligase activator of nfkb 1-A [Tripterygium wilfordii]|uniref:RING-type E3 ubiquitin transferase n=1 Tax=Tripterygium wilfordii TaxID=458696 RepID=A0A7J7DGP9_TRIWF|nr:E3 ubiquitin-protein ligase SPL2-like [Tripterygium wilfordii]KAF5745555.1 mitochondrial ubiquitin ligase activator of nfkb 1-A [Tripterygium wilfordii]